MSKIIFGNFEDLPSIGTPSSGYIVAYDLDGVLKQKDVFGNITLIGNTSTYSLDEVLAAGNLSGTYSIIMGTSSIIQSANGGGAIHFDYPGASAVSITTDGLSYSETYLTLAQDNIKLNYKYSGSTGMLLQAGTAGEFLINSPTGTILHVNGTDFIKSAISTFSTPDTAKYSTIISSRGSKVNNGVVNSVILGGQNLTASTNNTVYVGSLNVNNTYTLPTTDGTNGFVLKTDGSGNVTWQSDVSTSTWAEVLNVGNTSSTDIIISNGNKIKSPNSNVLIDFNNGSRFQAGFTDSLTQSFITAGSSYSKLEFKNKLSENGGFIYMSGTEYEISASSSISIDATEVGFGKPSLKNTPLKFYNSTNSNSVTLQSGLTTTSYTLTLPAAQGASNTYLKNDGSGNLIWGTQSASSLSDTLLIGNTTSTNIVMTTGHKLVTSVTTPYKVELTMIGGSAARFLMDNESSQTKAWFYGDIDSFESGFNNNYVYADDTNIEMVSSTASNSIQVKFIADSINNRAQIGVEVGTFKADSIEVLNNSLLGATSTQVDKFPTFISTRGATFTTGVYNSTIIGGSAISATQSNTVYLGNFVNINNAYTLPNTDGTAGHVLKTNGAGLVTWQLDDPGPTPSLAQVLNISNTTGTYSINVENYISFDGQGVSQSIDNFASASPLSGFQYRVSGDKTTAIYPGSLIKVLGTDIGTGTNDGQFIISNATYSGGYTYFQWTGIQMVITGPPYGDVSYAREKSYLQVNAASQSNYYNLPNKSGTIALLDDISTGTSGTSGINGTSGTSGVSGTSGINGTSGTSGINGTSGVSGTSGINGTSGVSGTSGINGTSGVSGTSGTSGVSGTSGTSGVSGTSGINGTSGTSGINGTSGVSGTSGTGFSTISNYADNRILTSDGTTNAANAESNLTFDGTLLTVGGNLLVTGSMSILGSSSVINTTNLVVGDSLIVLAHSQSAGLVDAGILIDRGTDATQSLFWDESTDQWCFASTDTNHETGGPINILTYSNIIAGGATFGQIKITNGASNGYVLSSDGVGLASWQPTSTIIPKGSKNIYVDAIYGSNSTGEKYDFTKRFRTIAAAENVAVDGDTIYVMSSSQSYTDNGIGSVFSNGTTMNYYFELGAKIDTRLDSSSNIDIFVPDGSNLNVMGYGEFIASGCVGLIFGSSSLNIEMLRGVTDNTTGITNIQNGSGTFEVSGTSYLNVKCYDTLESKQGNILVSTNKDQNIFIDSSQIISSGALVRTYNTGGTNLSLIKVKSNKSISHGQNLFSYFLTTDGIFLNDGAKIILEGSFYKTSANSGSIGLINYGGETHLYGDYTIANNIATIYGGKVYQYGQIIGSQSYQIYGGDVYLKNRLESTASYSVHKSGGNLILDGASLISTTWSIYATGSEDVICYAGVSNKEIVNDITVRVNTLNISSYVI